MPVLYSNWQVMKMSMFASQMVLACFLSVSCSSTEVAVAQQKASPVKKTKVAKPVTEYVSVTDPVEDGFTVQMPKGWNNRGYSARAYDIHRSVCISVSPDGDTVLFSGDPSLPQYFLPRAATPIHYQFAKVNPLIKIEDARPADVYAQEYAKRKFGKLDGFQVQGVDDDPKTANSMREAFAKHGMQIEASSAILNFTYTDKGSKSNGKLFISVAVNDSIFSVDVSGISTKGKPADFEPMLMKIRTTFKVNPQWQAKQQQLHQQRMAQIEAHGRMMTQRHNENMAWIQRSAQRHQARMQSIWASNDAQMQSYWQRSANSDLQHQRFLNYINDENTVVGSDGKAFQVDNSYERYFMHKRNGTYLGGDKTWDLDTLRKFNLNPDDYEEVKIRN